IKHTVLDYSDDCELLEIITPADFETGSWNSLSRLKKRAGTARSNSIIREEAMMVRERATRRTILRGGAAASAPGAAPACLRHATPATPIKIRIPTPITRRDPPP